MLLPFRGVPGELDVVEKRGRGVAPIDLEVRLEDIDVRSLRLGIENLRLK